MTPPKLAKYARSQLVAPRLRSVPLERVDDKTAKYELPLFEPAHTKRRLLALLLLTALVGGALGIGITLSIWGLR